MSWILLLILSFIAAPVSAANPDMDDDLASMMGWLTKQTAQGLGFNSGSSFDPPNEMRPWRIQPDISLGAGYLPFDKGSFPKLQIKDLEEKGKASLPDKMLFPNLTVHLRMGLPGRMDLGLRVANMSTPKNYQMSEGTTGNGQSNTIGLGLRRHFMGGHQPLVTVGAFYQNTYGYFNTVSKFNEIELVSNQFYSGANLAQLAWNIKTVGANAVVSQAYGNWIPFMGAGYNRAMGSVKGRLEAVWNSNQIQPSSGEATNSPEQANARVILGVQRQASLFNLFLSGEVKALGAQSGKTFVISTGLAAPFRIGSSASLVRGGRNRPDESELADDHRDEEEFDRPRVVRQGRNQPRRKEARRDAGSQRGKRVDRYWTWNDDSQRKAPSRPASSRGNEKSEMVFIR